ncbi:hypothetical protein ACP6O2_002058 [Cronobacter dublinensis]
MNLTKSLKSGCATHFEFFFARYLVHIVLQGMAVFLLHLDSAQDIAMSAIVSLTLLQLIHGYTLAPAALASRFLKT